MKYPIIVLLKAEGFAITRCCALLKVSCSGFYEWRKRTPSSRDQRNERLKEKIVSIFEKSKNRYGSPRVLKQLQREGEKVGKDKVANLMQEAGLSAKRKRAFRPKTTINNPTSTKAPRVFKIEENHVIKSNQVWASDLTYLPTDTGFSYLVVVMDLFNREIKGWHVSDSMEAENTQKALLGALQSSPGELKSLTFHSDQGIQYCSSQIRNKLRLLNITQSMSRKGNCYDNAFVESFFHSLKTELEQQRFKNHEEARKQIFDYINWYNRERLHSSLGYMSPMEYVNQECHAA